jgi:hypothetical protein
MAGAHYNFWIEKKVSGGKHSQDFILTGNMPVTALRDEGEKSRRQFSEILNNISQL